MLSLESLKRKIDLNNIEILYILSLSICFQTTLPYFGELNYFIRYFITFAWFCYFGVLYFKKRVSLPNFKDYIVLMIPVVFIGIYSLFLLLIGQMEISYIGRFISSMVSIIAPFLMVFIGHALFEKDIFKIGILSFFCSFLILFIANIIYYGIGDTIFQWVNSVFIDNSTAKNHFEVHDMTFASAELLLFVSLYLNKKILNKKNISFVLAIFIVFILGFKRIAILALLAVAVLIVFNKLLLKNKSMKFKKNYFLFILSAFIVLLFAYVWIIDSGVLTKICEMYNINTMDRIHFYQWLSEYFDFSLFFIGKGFGASSKMMHLYNAWGIYFNIGSIHSDVLKLFFEVGFMGFLALLIYYFFMIPNYINKEKKGVTSIYIYLQILLFVFHLTDNTYTYYMTQFYYAFIFIWLCTHQTLEEKNETSINHNSSL